MTRLLCQFDAYQRSVCTDLVSSTRVDRGYEVVLRETVLYPEGGGQPADHGTVAGHEVLELYRREDSLVHLLAEPVEGSVEVVVDWTRRYDHMQQHTAQHLITAVAQDQLGWATTAFHLHPDRCDIELDCPDGLSQEAMRDLEQRVNKLIRKHLAVTCLFVDAEAMEQLQVRTRGLPEGFSGQVRLLDIAGVDLNTCGGTHVANTAEIQAIKLTGTEHLRGGTRLFYLAGRRVLHRLEAALERERALTQRLSCGPEDHLAAVDRLLDEARQHKRDRRALLQELAALLGRSLIAEPGVVSLHRPEGEMEFLHAIALAVREQQPDKWVLLTGGERAGVFILLGPADSVASMGPIVAELLDGRGGGAKGIFQGKASRLDRRQEALRELSNRAE